VLNIGTRGRPRCGPLAPSSVDDSNLNAVGGKSRFETLVGTAMKDLFADAASGRAITADAIKAKPSAANQQVKAGG
jgi:hypothetical protein